MEKEVVARTVTFTIPGRPATKKTGQRIVKCGKFSRILPSKAYCEYEEYCLIWLKRIKTHFLGRVAIKAIWKMPNKQSWPDWTGLAQATGDILEKAGIIENDRLIDHWDGSRVIIDKDNPGVEITITEITPF